MMPGCLNRDLGVSEQFESSLKSLIYFDVDILIDFQATFFEHLEIVFGSSGTSDWQNDSAQKANNQQGFDGVSLFLPE